MPCYAAARVVSGHALREPCLRRPLSRFARAARAVHAAPFTVVSVAFALRFALLRACGVQLYCRGDALREPFASGTPCIGARILLWQQNYIIHAWLFKQLQTEASLLQPQD